MSFADWQTRQLQTWIKDGDDLAAKARKLGSPGKKLATLRKSAVAAFDREVLKGKDGDFPAVKDLIVTYHSAAIDEWNALR
ncbi:hypothetical protein [Amycolatopsis sp. NPDC050768]|uniref:hypothetical protein n=1 Tax=Amycolatopsis sp. NPDC050768 TaxID=3154839 RepID=UPI0033C5D461